MAGLPSPIDPDLARLLEAARQAGRPPFEAMSPVQARAAYAATWDVLQPPAEAVASVQDVSIDGPAGPLALRIYRSAGTTHDQVLHGTLFLHGGGWVIGNLDSHDRLCRQIANRSAGCVVAVDYRLAPEHPFPAAVEDCESAWRWVHDNAKRLRIDPERFAVAGDSAGGNLAAVLTLLACKGELPSFAAQVLIYPVTDLTASSAGYQRVTSDVPLTASTMHYFIGHYTPDVAMRRDWRASPASANDLSGLPRSLVMTVRHDPLCEEGLDYASRLQQAGVAVTHVHLEDQMHGLLTQGRWVRMGARMADMVGQWIGVALGGN
jgi:acetyl esterase